MKCFTLVGCFMFLLGCTVPSSQQVSATVEKLVVLADTPNIQADIVSAVSALTAASLNNLSKNDPVAAAQVAAQLPAAINNILLPYFQKGAQMQLASEVQSLLNINLLNNLNGLIKTVLTGALAMAPLPSTPKSTLSQADNDLLVSVLTGITQGCGNILSKN